MNQQKQGSAAPTKPQSEEEVHWYAWGKEAFERAKIENKPVLVNIGYQACHWCQVMEEESFQDKKIIDFLNQHLICIRVDRDELPSVNHFYMEAVKSLSGSGGWPLNVFVTPERAPFYGGTYFPVQDMKERKSWRGVLEAVVDAWKNHPVGIREQVEEMRNHLEKAVFIGISENNLPEIEPGLVDGICSNLLENADREWGGFGDAPKFLSGSSLNFLLDYYLIHKRLNTIGKLAEDAFTHFKLTVNKLMYEGIYDQVRGGFFKYVIDPHWQQPKFEKTLADNALMIILFSKIYRALPNPVYKRVLEETLAFCDRELKMEGQSGFYNGLGAESGGVEGGLYLWNHSEWSWVFPSTNPAVQAYFGMGDDRRGVEERHPLMCLKDDETIIREFHLTHEGWYKELSRTKGALIAEGNNRPQPRKEEKLLLSANALMNLALQEAAQALGNEDLAQKATQHLEWLETHFLVKGQWQHIISGSKLKSPANLDDLAFLIKTWLRFGLRYKRPDILQKAHSLMEKVLIDFEIKDHLFLYYTAFKELPVGKVEIYDGAQPSSNAMMAENLLTLGGVFPETKWSERGTEMLRKMGATTRQYARSFSYWGYLLQRAAYFPIFAG